MSNYTDPVTVSGSVVNFSAPDGGVIDSLILSVSPTQDLHGYSKPWPAGGGVNKYNMDDWPFTTTRRYWGTDPSSFRTALNALSAGTYTITAKIKIDALTDTTGNRTYGFLCTGVSIDGRKTIATPAVGSTVSVSKTFTLSSAQVGAFTHCYWYAGTASSTNDTCTIYEIGINVGSDNTYIPYSNICPITGKTGANIYRESTYNVSASPYLTVDWTDKGTVYGGTLDVVSGVLTVTKGKYVFNSNLSWTLSGTSFFYTNIGSGLTGTGYYLTENGVDFNYNINNGQVSVYLNRNLFLSTSSDMHSYMDGMGFVYDLATPLTYQLTPQQISVLVGENYVWNDSSNTTLTYRLLIVDWHKGATSIGKNTASLIVSQQFGAYSKVVINVTSELYYESGNDTGRTLTIDCPWGTQAMADNILASLEGYQYQPYEAESAILDPAAELGDGLTVNGVYGGIFKLTLRSGALHAVDVSSPQDEEIDHEYQFTPASERKIERRLANMQSELSVQADQIAAKVDENGGDSSFGWSLTSNGFTLESNGSNVMTVDSTGLTVNGNGTFTGTVQAKNIAYGGSNGTFSGGGISGGSITIGKCSSGINTSLGNADYSADVFSGAAVATFTKAKNLYCVGRFLYNGTEFTPAVYYLLDQNSNVVRIRCLQS